MIFRRAAANRGRFCIVVAALTALTGFVQPSEQRIVSGRVVRPHPTSPGVRPTGGIWVVLHRVGPDTSRPLDSVRTGSDGRYFFRYRTSGRSDAIYFVSASHSGIAYFSPPLRQARVTGDSAELTVFDTTSRPVPIRVRGRHLVMAAPRVDGAREIVEVFELSNDSSVTLVSADGIRATWSTLLPAGVTKVAPGPGDLSADALQVALGRAMVVSPFAPGLKQLSYAYTLAPGDFPLSLPLEHPVPVLEVLSEEPTATVEGARLAEVNPVSVEGRTFKRFLAQDVPANAVVSVKVMPASALSSRRGLYIAAVAIAIGAAMLAALARSFARR